MFLLFIPTLKAESFKTDYIDINDYAFYEGQSYSFNIYRISNKYFENHLNINFIKKENSDYFKYIVYYYDKDKKEIDRVYRYEYAGNNVYININKEEIKYYRLIFVSVDSDEYNKHAYDNNNVLEINESELKEVKLSVLYSDNNKDNNLFYMNNYNIDINIVNLEELEKNYIVRYNHNFDLIVNKDIDEYKFKLIDSDIKNIVVKLSDLNIIYTIDKDYITFYNLKKGTINIDINYDIKQKYESYGLISHLFQNNYETNLFDYINLKIHSPFEINKEESLYCTDECFINNPEYINNYEVTTNIKGKFFKNYLYLFIDNNNIEKDNIKNIIYPIIGANTILFILGLIFIKYKNNTIIMMIISHILLFVPFFIKSSSIGEFIVILFSLVLFSMFTIIALYKLFNKNDKGTISKIIMCIITLLVDYIVLFNLINEYYNMNYDLIILSFGITCLYIIELLHLLKKKSLL